MVDGLAERWGRERVFSSVALMVALMAVTKALEKGNVWVEK